MPGLDRASRAVYRIRFKTLPWIAGSDPRVKPEDGYDAKGNQPIPAPRHPALALALNAPALPIACAGQSLYLAAMLKSLYDKMMELAAHRRAPGALFAVAFAESSVFPIPPDVMLIPMVLAERAKAWSFALIATAGSVLGGVAGYAIGYFLFETVGRAVLDFYGLGQEFQSFADKYNAYGAWIVLMAGITPFPYKVITIASGATQLNMAVFMLASVLARGVRFFAVAGLLYWFGPPIRDFIERRFALVSTLFFVSLVGGFLLIEYLR